MLQAYMPQGNTSLVAVTTTASTGYQPTSGNIQGARIANIGSVPVYVAFSNVATITAAIPTTATPGNGIPILPNSAETMALWPNFYLSAISTGASQLFISPGIGL